MAEAQKVGDLFQAKAFAPNDLHDAVADYMKDEKPGPVALGKNYMLDIAAAIEAHEQASVILANPESPKGLRRTMVLTAIIAAVPEKV